MGCDIHMFLEYKIDDGKWTPHKGHRVITEDKGTVNEFKHVSTIDATGRNYFLFAALAGVRGPGPDPKGIPKDLSDTIHIGVHQYGNDGHSHSYMSIEEFEEVLKKCNFKETDRTDIFYDWKTLDFESRPPDFTTIVAACKKEQEEFNIDNILLDSKSTIQYRVVFFFDN